MITEKDLQEAIAECEGIRNPNANTCIMLAAFYTLRREMFGMPETVSHSYAVAPTRETMFESDTEFGQIIAGKDTVEVWKVIDELMGTLHIINPRLYDSVLRKLKQI